MKIKDRIALYFTVVSTSTLLLVLCTVYFTFMKFLQTDFFERLTDRTMVTANLYLEADEITPEALNQVRNKYLQKLNGEIIRIYNDQNDAAFIEDDNRYWTKNTINEVRKLGRLKFKDGNRQAVGIYYKDNQGDFVILASAIDWSSISRLDKLRNIIIVFFFLSSTILLLSARWVAKKMLHPLDELTEEVKKTNSLNMQFRVKTSTNKDEINLLAENFNHLMDELDQAFTLQKTFAANASHELRTPITRIMMTAELALSKDRLIADYQSAILSILDDAEQMDRTITGLLSLAKMDLEMIRSQLSPISLIKLLFKIKSSWKQQDLDLNILLPNISDDGVVLALANEVLLQVALNNMVSNAFKFSNNQTVTCILENSNAVIKLHICDKGNGIKPEFEKEIFKPFYTRSKDVGMQGEGLGLYMASKIINLFKGNIEVASTTQSGSTFIVVLPRF